MVDTINEIHYRGIVALHYQKDDEYRICFVKPNGKDIIADYGIRGLKNPWEPDDIRHAIDIMVGRQNLKTFGKECSIEQARKLVQA